MSVNLVYFRAKPRTQKVFHGVQCSQTTLLLIPNCSLNLIYLFFIASPLLSRECRLSVRELMVYKFWFMFAVSICALWTWDSRDRRLVYFSNWHVKKKDGLLVRTLAYDSGIWIYFLCLPGIFCMICMICWTKWDSW